MTVENELPILSIDDALQFVGDAELFVEITGMLLEELPEQMGLVQAHWDEGDLAELARTAHRLKGNFGVVAAHQAQAAAKKLEQSARAGDSATAEQAVGELQEAVELVVPELERHISQGAA